MRPLCPNTRWGSEISQWEASILPSWPIRDQDWLHPAPGLWASGNVEGDTQRWGQLSLNRSLVKSELKTSLYQIWEHVFVIILGGQKVWSVPILIMAIICHPWHEGIITSEMGENSRPNYRSLNIFLTGKYEAGETLSELHPPEYTGPGTF